MTNTTVELPEHLTMTARVVDRGTSRSYEGVKIRTVTIQNRCPKCLGPRGEVKPYRFCEDGAWYDCDRWDNPCGHVDMYAAVLAEAKRLIENSTPRFASCNPEPGMNRHQLSRAFGYEWCECEHVGIVHYVNNRGGAELEYEEPPTWWREALLAYYAATARELLDAETVWTELVRLHNAIAWNGDQWDRWDEFDGYWEKEDRLRLLEDAGIASVVVADHDWQEQHEGRESTWHSGAECGCTEVDFELLTEQKASV